LHAPASSTTVSVSPGPITTLTLKSTQGLHLLHSSLIQQLLDVLIPLAQDPPAVVILTGGNAKAFCAGADMHELIGLTDIPAYVALGQRLTETIYHFPAPVIAAINGYALGAGFSLAMACDLRLISDRARIGQLAVRNALTPPFGNLQHLIAAIGSQRTRELVYTGRILTAEQALSYGLVSQVCAPERLQHDTQALATDIAAAHPAVVRRVKSAINTTLEAGFAAGYQAQEEALITSLGAEASRTIMRSFLTSPPSD
jgi:enoyl-CoA hydratase